MNNQSNEIWFRVCFQAPFRIVVSKKMKKKAEKKQNKNENLKRIKYRNESVACMNIEHPVSQTSSYKYEVNLKVYLYADIN